jgi:glutamate synthase (NADPH/NADH) large chain
MAFVYDTDGGFESRINDETLTWQRIEMPYWENRVKALVEMHVEMTQSRFAARLLNAWTREQGKFRQVVPREMLNILEHPVTRAADDAERA